MVRGTATSLRKTIEMFKGAVKKLTTNQSKGTKNNMEGARQELESEIKDAETVMKHGDRQGFTTTNVLTLVNEAKRLIREDEIGAIDVARPSKKTPNKRGGGDDSETSERTGESKRTQAQSNRNEARLMAKTAENELNALRELLKGKEAMVRAAKDNLQLHEDHVSTEEERSVKSKGRKEKATNENEEKEKEKKKEKEKQRKSNPKRRGERGRRRRGNIAARNNRRNEKETH